MAFWLDLATLAGSRVWIQEIAGATPPGGESLDVATTFTDHPKGAASNGFALGRDRTVNGRGVLLSNVHLPFEDELMLHEVHLTIPDEIDVAGASLSGAMGVQLGFTPSMAWTHTTSPSNQFILYTLDLVPGNPTRYYFGDEERDMQASTYTVQVLQDDGTTAEQSRTLYSSHYGPMFDPSGFGLAWNGARAYTLFDINAENGALMDTFLSINRAESVAELREIFETVGGVPWNHTMATDRSGEVLYADATLVPNLSEEGEAAFQALVESDVLSFTKVAFGLGLVVLDGSDPLFSIDYDQSATRPGAIPFSKAPKLIGRRDFVANSNNSYWLSNPEEPLSGYSLRYGDVGTPRSLRTRMGLTQLSEMELWDRVSIRDMLFENRSYTEELWRDQFVGYCDLFETAQGSSGETVDIRQACAVLAGWDGRLNLDSVGAILHRELMSSVDGDGLLNGVSYFSEAFDASSPVTTPRGLTAEGEEYLLGQLADAVLRLEKTGIPLDAPLGDYQFIQRGDTRFPLHGGQQTNDGALNKVEYRLDQNLFTSLLPNTERPPVVNERTDLTRDGYLMNFGASFIMAVEFTDDGPVADALMTYSQSSDPASAHFSDQTELYGSKTWRPLPYSREQIEADSSLTSITIEE